MRPETSSLVSFFIPVSINLKALYMIINLKQIKYEKFKCKFRRQL